MKNFLFFSLIIAFSISMQLTVSDPYEKYYDKYSPFHYIQTSAPAITPETPESTDLPPVAPEIPDQDIPEEPIEIPFYETYPNMWAISATEVIVPEDKTVYLTFDDGPSNRTLEILDILDTYQIHGTFFVSAQTKFQMTEEILSIMNQIIERGHTLGVHTYSHKYEEIYANTDAFYTDFELIFNLIEEQTGYRPNIFRFPGGSNNRYAKPISAEIFAEMNSRGFVYYDWNSSVDDSVSTPYTPSELANNAILNFKTKGHTIVLMHDSENKVNTVLALPEIIEYGLANGYTFDKLDNSIKPIQFSS